MNTDAAAPIRNPGSKAVHVLAAVGIAIAVIYYGMHILGALSKKTSAAGASEVFLLQTIREMPRIRPLLNKGYILSDPSVQCSHAGSYVQNCSGFALLHKEGEIDGQAVMAEFSMTLIDGLWWRLVIDTRQDQR